MITTKITMMVLLALVGGLTLVGALATACATFAPTPAQCVEAARNAGLSDETIEQMNNMPNLNNLEKTGLRTILQEAGVHENCADAFEKATATELADKTLSDEPDDQTSSAQREQLPPEERNRMPGDEYQRRCDFWALNNIEPPVYAEFTELDPHYMDDLDRPLWSSKLRTHARIEHYVNPAATSVANYLSVRNYLEEHGAETLRGPRDPGIYCLDYWTEKLNENNAHLRNQRYETECRSHLENGIRTRYLHFRDALNEDANNELIYRTPNQYARILEWLDMSGKELLASKPPPYRILSENSKYPYAHLDDWIPTAYGMRGYQEVYRSAVDLEWLGIISAAGLKEDSDLNPCHLYYPQLFFGYWAPLEYFHVQRRSPQILPAFTADTTPLYFPKLVTASRVSVGYPLGMTADRYYLCYSSSDTKRAGYRYVEHPDGHYCEKNE